MTKKIVEFLHAKREYFYFVFRIAIGFLFLLHGLNKFELIGAGQIELMGRLGLAAVIEGVAGLLIILGLFVRYTAVITAVEMIFAYFLVHASRAISPLSNGGEPAVLFFLAFLVL